MITSRAWLRWLRIDALNRAWRTVLQGIVATALGAAGDVVLQAVQKSMFDHAPLDWRQVGHTAAYTAGTSALMAILAYLHRAKIDPTSIPSAQPPAPPIGSAPATTPPPVR
jgi:hypothetical protein